MRNGVLNQYLRRGVPLANIDFSLTNGDSDGSGEVNTADINILIANFGATCD